MMIFLYKGRLKVKVSFDGKSGDILILDELGEKTLELYKRARLEWMQKAGMMFSGFKESLENGKLTYKFMELYFAYIR